MKKKTTAQLKKILWRYFSLFIRRRDKGICFTCGRRCEGKGYHAGHFIPKSICGVVLYFDERNVHGQCYNCNINLGGNHYIYGKKLGTMADQLYADKLKFKDIVWGATEYERKIAYYKEKTACA